MPPSCKSSVATSPKPMNIFYVWYTELCRRSNSSPLSIVKPAKPKNDTVLDFTADRIKVEEWTPILNALRLDTSLHVLAIRSRVVGCKFLYEMNTEDRVRRMKRRTAALWTDYVLRSLMRSLSCTLKNTQVLSCLELDGLPISGDYLELLLPTLRNNRTIKMLSFKRCPINDFGCQQLCLHLRFMPNIEVLNLSACNLSAISGQHIARVIKHQQINRYCESWHNSLRYEEPEIGIMAGLKRITLNSNPSMGDEGLSYILDELDDDLWIKAIDMQRCNITENVSSRLIDVVEYSKSLEVADFRNNEQLSFATVEKILETLERKQQFGNDPEYQWCVTTSTLYDFATYEPSQSESGSSTIIQKSYSAPLKQMESISKSSLKPTLRRTKTLAMLDRRPRHDIHIAKSDLQHMENAKKQLSELNTKLQEEISRRRETEKVNSELQKKLDGIRKLGSLHTMEQLELKDKTPEVIRIFEDLQMDGNEGSTSSIKGVSSKKGVEEKLSKSNSGNKSKGAKKAVSKRAQNRPKTPRQKRQKSPAKPVSPTAKEDAVQETSIAQSIFEQFLSKSKQNGEDLAEDDKEDNFLNYYDLGWEDDFSTYPTEQVFKAGGSQSPASSSTVSLERFLREMNIVDEDLQLRIDTDTSPNQTSSRTGLLCTAHQSDADRFRKVMVKV